MKLLVTGANGFIGSAIVEAVICEGHTVIAVGRSAPHGNPSSAIKYVKHNLKELTHKEDWLPLLDEVDAVINCAGILRADLPSDYQSVHIDAPLALAEACSAMGISRYIQISALGCPEDGEFIASKHRFDQQLLECIPSATLLRPSVVVSLRGSYGGTSMLRGLAAFPQLLLLPGNGEQKIQPILLEDLAQLVVEAVTVEKEISGVIEVGGSEAITIKSYLTGLRSWLQISTYRSIAIPLSLIKLACQVGDRLKAGPLNSTIISMLETGNVISDPKPLQQFSNQPHNVLGAFQRQTSFVQDRWHAKLFLLQPFIWFLLCFIWFVSAISGFTAQTEQFSPILSTVGFPDSWHFSLVMLTSILDLVLAATLLTRYKEELTLWLMLISTLGYSALLGLMAPELWLDPLGGLLKNLAIIPLILVYMVMRKAR